jgi:hypothetical protein
MLAIGIGVLTIMAVSFWIDDGEVVILETTDSSGEAFETELWLVEHQRALYVRGVRGSRWVQRVRSHPEVILVRGADQGFYHARPSRDPETVAQVNAAMASKYGLADRLFGALFEEGDRVAIRLDPGSRVAAPSRRAEVSPSHP